MKEIVAVLVNIRSIWNVGSMFRTADTVGISRIYLCGITPSPLDRFGTYLPAFAKVSLGAERWIPWEQAKSAVALLLRLKRAGYAVCAVEQGRRSIPYRIFKPRARQKIALVVGNEVRGLPPTILKHSDAVLEIPMHGALVRQAHHPRHSGRGKESLNVAVAFGIIAYRLIE